MGLSLFWATYQINKTLNHDEFTKTTLVIVSNLSYQLHSKYQQNSSFASTNFKTLQIQLNEHLKNKPDISPHINSLITKLEQRNKSILALSNHLNAIEKTDKNLAIRKHLIDKLLTQTNGFREDSIRISFLLHDEIKKIISAQLIGLIIIMFISFFILTIGITKIFRTINHSLSILTKRSIAVGKGDFINPIQGLNDDEFGTVAKHFNHMLHKLSETTASKDSLQQLVDERTEELKKLSEIDALTKIPNRRFYNQRITSDIASEKRKGRSLGLLMIDIDLFKGYNDGYGHDMGDIVLSRIAQAIRESLPRATDSVSRYGGEEFVVLLPSTDTEGALVIAERIRTYIKSLAIPHDHSPDYKVVTVSIGASSLKGDELNEIDLLKQADLALYQSKENGRNLSTPYKVN